MAHGFWSSLVSLLGEGKKTRPKDRRVFRGGNSPYVRRLRVEPLENRSLLTVVVNTALDVVDDADSYMSLREAVEFANANSGEDAIEFDVSLSGQTITLDSELGQLELTDTTGKTTIQGFSADQSTISGDDASRVFYIEEDVEVDLIDLTITGGYTDGLGGGIYNAGTLTIADCAISANTSDFCNCAVYNLGVFSIEDSSISENGGYGIMNDNGGVATVAYCTISQNASSGIWNAGVLAVTNCTISDNATTDAGGGICNYYDGEATITDCTISDNTSDLDGGGVYNYHGPMTIANCTISGNTGRYGGGIYSPGAITITGSMIDYNVAANGYGGGICNNSNEATISNCTISGNSAANGGGICNFGAMTITASSVDGNIVEDDAYGWGGGIYSQGNLTVTDSTIAYNSAVHYGGGICVDAGGTISTVFTGCTISGNMSDYGGGIYLLGGLSLALTNSTIAENSAGSGAAIYMAGGYDEVVCGVTVTNCTIAVNIASGQGGGIVSVAGDGEAATVILHNTIVAENTGGSDNDVYGTVTANYCLIEDASGTTFSAESADNISGVDPSLSPLCNSGGTTDTMALHNNSPAINAGNNAYAAGITTDQRGGARIVGDAIDLGACESQNPTTLDVELTASETTATFGSAVEFTCILTLSNEDATEPVGTVSFYDGTTLLEAVDVVDGEAVLMTSALTAGTHAITATYNGDMNYLAASDSVTLTVVKDATTLTLEPSDDGMDYGEAITFSVVVEANTSELDVIPTGTVAFYDGTSLLTTVTLVHGGASYTTSKLTSGVHTIQAVYSGDANYEASTAAIQQEVVAWTAYITLESLTDSPSTYSQAVKLKAYIEQDTLSKIVPTGTVTFYDGSELLDTVAVSGSCTARLTLSTLSVGSHTIRAVYSGDSVYSGDTDSVVQAVDQVTTSMKLKASSKTTVYGRTVTWTVSVASARPATVKADGTVVFYDGETVLGDAVLDSKGKASFQYSTLSVGSHNITARYAESANFTACQATMIETINQAKTKTILSSTAVTATLGEPVTLTATVNVVSPGSGMPSGTLTFWDGLTYLGSAEVDSNGQAQITLSDLTTGTHKMMVYYSGDSSFRSSASRRIIVKIAEITLSSIQDTALTSLLDELPLYY